MATNRCSTCSVNYPLNVSRCWSCGGKLSPLGNDTPDEDWKEKAAELKHAADIAAEVSQDIPLLVADVVDRDGRYFISSLEVCQGGYQTPLYPDMLVRVGEGIFEVVGYIDKTREYWIELLAGEIANSFRESNNLTPIG